jgi:hypothetical protein
VLRPGHLAPTFVRRHSESTKQTPPATWVVGPRGVNRNRAATLNECMPRLGADTRSAIARFSESPIQTTGCLVRPA